jgi:hypothetical protein
MNPENPYQPPQAFADGPPPYMRTEGGDVPAAIMEAMRSTRPWVTFLAILGFIGTGLMVIAGLVIVSIGGVAKLPAPIGLVYVVLALLYLAPSWALFRYGAGIRALLDQGGGMDRLTHALVCQKSFWRMVGIFTLVVMGLYALILVGGAVVLAMRAA